MRRTARSVVVLIAAALCVPGTATLIAKHEPPPKGGVRSAFAGRVASTGTHSGEPVVRPLTPKELLGAYGIDQLHSRGLDGTGVTVVVPAIDHFDNADLVRFAAENHLERFDVSQLGAPAEASFGEIVMDLSIIHAVAPRAKLVVANWSRSDLAESKAGSLDSLLARFPGSVWSWSIGMCERDASDAGGLEETIARHAQAEGTVHFAASGDSGGYDCYPHGGFEGPPDPSYIGAILPAAAPSVTAVGGTRITLGGTGAVSRETPWYWPAVLAGSGGGSSSVFSGRTVPDVAADADPSSGMLFRSGGALMSAGGTSASAPLWAGIAALFVQEYRRSGRTQLGPFNPKLNRIGTAVPGVFRHPVRGSNAVAAAAPGHDSVTGWGVPMAEPLLEALLREDGRG